MEHVIVIGPSGVVKAMHNDKFPMGFLGKQTIERASDIRFDDESQAWGIWFNVDGVFVPPARASHKGYNSYEAARDHEVAVMNETLKTGLCPTAVD